MLAGVTARQPQANQAQSQQRQWRRGRNLSGVANHCAANGGTIKGHTSVVCSIIPVNYTDFQTIVSCGTDIISCLYPARVTTSSAEATT